MEIRAYAKINLSLNILSAGKMHRIDSVMATINLFDTIYIEEAASDSVRFDEPAVGPDNSVTAALKLLKNRPRYKIFVKKGIPLGMGLGGSSADAAALLRALGGGVRAARRVGSDVPFMMGGGYARVRGTGEKLDFFSAPPLDLVLLTAGPVSAGAAYRGFDFLVPEGRFAPSDNGLLIGGLKAGDLEVVGRQMNNALSEASASLVSSIQRRAEALTALKPYGVTMTGSGGGVIALFSPDRVKAAAAESGGMHLKTVCRTTV